MKNSKITKNNFFTRPIVLLLIGSFFLRIGLSFWGTLILDQNTFIAWGHSLALNGFAHFYDGWSDYLPGYLYVLWFLAKLQTFLPIPPVLLYKLPGIVADSLCGFVVYSLVCKEKGERTGLLSACLVLLNPAVFVNSTLWGQVDILTSLFSVLAVAFASKNWPLSAIFLAIGALIKPQAAIAALVVLFVMIRDKLKLYKIIGYVVVSGTIFLVGFLPFLGGQSVMHFAFSRLGTTLSQYPYTSINAFNFWGLWGFWKQESVGLFSQKNIGVVLFFVFGLVTVLKYKAEKYSEYLLLTVLFLGNFLFFTRMHERHLLPALISLAIAVGLDLALLVPLIFLSLTYLANMYYSYVWISQDFKEVFSAPLISVFIFLNLTTLFCILFKSKLGLILNKTKRLKEYVLEFWKQKRDVELPETANASRANIFLVGILFFALATRLIGLSNPDHEYFDEVYHAFTARAMLHNDKRAWEWWNENPVGFAFEWTHPPLAKEAMVLGMLIFGENSFGWRASAAIFGTGVVFLIYKLGEKLFNKEIGLLASFVFSLDGLGLVLSRIGMNDIYLVFFLLLSFLLFFSEKYFWASVALGLAMASKWTTFWFFPIFALVLVLKKRKFTKDIVPLLIPPFLFFGSVAEAVEHDAFVIAIGLVILFLVSLLYLRKKMGVTYMMFIPFFIYLASYAPLFLSGHSWDIFWGMQRQMWWYHTRLVATHPYESSWWSWPLMLRPIWLYTSGEASGGISNIYAMGNPAVFWGGLVAIMFSFYYLLVERRKNLLLVFASYVFVFVPWALSPRIMFLYHYFPALPFLALATGFVLYKNRKAIAPVLIIFIISFVYFYPHWAGISVPTWLNDSYFWFPGWR